MFIEGDREESSAFEEMFDRCADEDGNGGTMHLDEWQRKGISSCKSKAGLSDEEEKKILLRNNISTEKYTFISWNNRLFWVLSCFEIGKYFISATLSVAEHKY